MKILGPTFGDEVIRAGLGGLPFSWANSSDTIDTSRLDPEQVTALEAVIAAHDPDKPLVPQTVTPRQARLALFAAGLLPAVEDAVVAAGGVTKITWEYATEINRSDALITTLGYALGLNDAAIDALFVQAAAIP